MQTKKSNIETEFMAIQEQLESYLYRLSANREDAIKSYQKAIELGYEDSHKKLNDLKKN